MLKTGFGTLVVTFDLKKRKKETKKKTKKQNPFPLASQSKSSSSLSSQSDLFTFLKSDLNKAPELGKLPGKPYTEAQFLFKK